MKLTVAIGLLLFMLILFGACSKNDDQQTKYKEGTGEVWLSGGLWYCATQIRMENGDTLIPVPEIEVHSKFTSGEKVNVIFIESDDKKSGCTIGKECEIIDIRLAE